MSDPINCVEAEERLHDYLRQELTPEVEQQMRAHIDRCRHCFQHYQFEANFFLMLETRAARQPCPDALRKRILDLLRAEARRG
ncbi:MAG: zf-HC2 domain-containing protein [Gemmatimonadales bacterium]